MSKRAAIVASLFLAGCAATPQQQSQRVEAELDRISEHATPVKLTDKQLIAVRKGVAQSLKDPESARFGRIIAGQTSQGIVVCGYVNGKNSYGGYIGEKPFVGVLVEPDKTKFSVTEIGGAEKETFVAFKVCRTFGLELEFG
jgi:hypothetical protein